MNLNNFHESRAGRSLVHRKVRLKLQGHICDTFALECFSGRDGGENFIERVLQRDMTRIEI